jgi:multidrug efflux system membrane fusion protein
VATLAAAAAAKPAAAPAPATQSPAQKSSPAQPVSPAQRPGAPEKLAPVQPVGPALTEPVRAGTIPARKRGGFGWLIWLIVLIALAVAGYFAWVHFHQPAAKGGAAGGKGHHGSDLPRVVTAVAARADIPDYLRCLGTVTPLNTVSVQSRVSGQLMKVLYTEGQMVNEGDHLLLIDPRPFQAVLDQDKATLEHDEALLENALIDDQRYQTLWQQNSIPQQTLATQESLVKQDQGTVDSDKAQVEAAQLNLTYCDITAPISGRVGLRLVDVGNYIQATGTTPLLVITQIQPITVIFTIPEDKIDAVTAAMKASPTLEVDAYPRVGFITSEGKTVQKLASGTLLTIDNQVDPTTGTVRLRALFPNTDNALFPNQFVNPRILVDTHKNVITVPLAAVQYGTSNNTFVYIVDTKASTVKLQAVTVGVTSFDGTTIEIAKGVNVGDTVVIDGVDKLQDGSKVILAKPVSETPTDDSGTAPDAGTAPGSGSASDSGTAADSGAAAATPGQKGQHHHHKKPSSDTNAAPAS